MSKVSQSVLPLARYAKQTGLTIIPQLNRIRQAHVSRLLRPRGGGLGPLVSVVAPRNAGS